MKSVLGGTFGFDERGVGVAETVARSYAALAPGQWWAQKLDGLRSLLGWSLPQTCDLGEMVWHDGWLGAGRIADFLAPAPSIKFLWLGLLVALVPAWRRAAPATRPALALLGAGALGIGVSWLVAWDCQIIPTQSYQSLLALVLGLLLLLAQGPAWLRVITLGASLAWSLAAWVVDPLLAALRVDTLALAAFSAVGAWSIWRYSFSKVV